MKKAVAKKNLKTNKLTPKKTLPQPFVDPGGAFRDRVTHAEATRPKAPVSDVMADLMLDPDKFIIVRTQRGGVTNRDEFKAELAKIGIRVIFLEYSPNNIAAPQVDFHTQVKR